MNFTIRWNDLDESKKIQLYTDYRVPPFRPEAVFSDGTNRYRLPAEPGEFQKVALRCRTALGNVERVDLVVDGVRYPMSVLKQDDLFEYYEVSILLEDKRVSYLFELFSGVYWKGVW